MKAKRMKVGLFKAMKLCADYSRMPEKRCEALRRKRLENVVMWAKQNSPYYAELYKDIGENFELSELPPVTKRQMMEHWDSWVTDEQLTLQKMYEFMQNTDNIGRKWNGRYMVLTTSGSTGEPLVAVCDDTTNGVMSGISAMRAYARKEDLRRFIKQGKKTIGVFADGGFYLANSTVRARLLQMPWKKKQTAVSNALLPIEELVAQLNEFQPAMFGGYPSNLELLIEEQKSGRLHISPVVIMTGGEYLSDDLRRRLAEAFNCYVQTAYSCTEGGTVACECREQHFHINDDWIILEAVDKNDQLVPDGVQSDKVLLTNLFNYTQPFIRYEISDRIIMHHEQCPCGNPSPWIEIEGRTDDMVEFAAAEGTVSLAPMTVYAALSKVRQLRRFQLVVNSPEYAEIRIEPAADTEPAEAFEAAKAALETLLLSYEAKMPEIVLSQEQPKQHPKSGKFKHIINLAKQENQ